MAYLTYTEKFQNDVIKAKENGMLVNDIKKVYAISIYTLYKILHLNGKLPTLSQAVVDQGSTEGAEHRKLSSNNNTFHERPASTWKFYGYDRHKKIRHICLRCKRIFYVRDRGNRTKFCSRRCKDLYKTENNSSFKCCDNCGKKFRIKNSQIDHFIHCEECRNKNLGRISSKMSRQIGKWLNKHFSVVEVEKSFEWLYDKTKPKGRFRLDYFLPEYNVAIEYDGEQHFKSIDVFGGKDVFKDRIKKDNIKNNFCNENNIKLLRIPYYDFENMENILKNYIK